jgi:hypothetical protein
MEEHKACEQHKKCIHGLEQDEKQRNQKNAQSDSATYLHLVNHRVLVENFYGSTQKTTQKLYSFESSSQKLLKFSSLLAFESTRLFGGLK